ncbi:histidine kinase dimerization/phospho-acceptor domain-containing protein [Plantactinospora sp. KLBMP9567]|uniref:histidine kinase dimerization/phospho-acceptor domain-containing protein n=1 Tax=Plantactinospora sp. KLBMP9567 TaxID=3085900 RepID=UPI0029815C94|nr:histidine kinase dimerization/phospho-acceptor domain-containing protein [Plantactinospora sp. KLBMP9567]MDW5324481.1 hypothetical protein [Plantactinospora sp. KLBMP9567]
MHWPNRRARSASSTGAGPAPPLALAVGPPAVAIPGSRSAPPHPATHERIALTGPPDEIRELADTFDLMLARLDQAFDSQRRFIGNASHELRTPLTLNRTLLEVMVVPDSASPSCASSAARCWRSTPGTNG